jgi:hypothetical protein
LSPSSDIGHTERKAKARMFLIAGNAKQHHPFYSNTKDIQTYKSTKEDAQ